jgi:hypothetical protein
MAIFTIDTDPTPLYWNQTTQLDGVEYLLRFYWSGRESAFYIGVYDQNENPIALSIRLVVGVPLLRRFQDPRLPPGMLLLVDTTDRGEDLENAADLGGRWVLVYFDAAELPSLVAA